MAQANGAPPTFRCSIGWVRRALRRQSVRYMSAVSEAADQDMNAVRTTKEKLPQLLMQLAVTPSDTFNFDETALYISILPRKTYGSLFTHFIEQLDAAMYTEGKKIVVLLDNASSHSLKTEGAVTEDLYGFCTVALGNVWLVYLPPNTTCFTQPLDQGLISMAKARYRQHWLRAFTRTWTAEGATSAVARFRPNMRAVVEWLNAAWMNIPPRAIQRCWWRTGCLLLVWALSLPHVEATPRNNGSTVVDGEDGTETGIDEKVNDAGLLVDRLGLGPSAMSAEAFVGIDDNPPTQHLSEDQVSEELHVHQDKGQPGGGLPVRSGLPPRFLSVSPHPLSAPCFLSFLPTLPPSAPYLHLPVRLLSPLYPVFRSSLPLISALFLSFLPTSAPFPPPPSPFRPLPLVLPPPLLLLSPLHVPRRSSLRPPRSNRSQPLPTAHSPFQPLPAPFQPLTAPSNRSQPLPTAPSPFQPLTAPSNRSQPRPTAHSPFQPLILTVFRTVAAGGRSA
ncbi:unnamed protein product [Closterium sp. NIES-64]|nr:unnamed protein product [Closterium sp. NIES-64]